MYHRAILPSLHHHLQHQLKRARWLPTSQSVDATLFTNQITEVQSVQPRMVQSAQNGQLRGLG
jgi:hypothetical protein